MPLGENGEAGKVSDEREKNLQMNEMGSISKAWISVDSSFCQSSLRICISTFYYDVIKSNDFRSVDFRRIWVSSHSLFFFFNARNLILYHYIIDCLKCSWLPNACKILI